MADPKKAVNENVEGDFFVDTTCIDCDTCRQLAPDTFDDAGEYSFVHHQPKTPEERRLALHALLSCPTGSIGDLGQSTPRLSKLRAKDVMNDFPLHVDGDVYYCGFTSPKSFGGSSYFIRHPGGNWLVDSPKVLPALTRKFEAWGGIRYIFLTHSDDVGDVHLYAEHFGAERIFHREELWAQPGTEIVIDGFDPVEIIPGFTVIPTPGHSSGHCSLLVQDKYLFSGDHMWWEPDEGRLALPRYYYRNYAEMVRSAQKLLDYRFEWILPGHGRRVHLPPEKMHEALEDLVRRNAKYLARPAGRSPR